MEKIEINAKTREVVGKKVNSLRMQGWLPGIIYGKGIQPIPIQVEYREADRLIPYLSSSQLIILNLDGEQHNVLLRDRQNDPVNSSLVHVDFLEVSMTEKLRASVDLELVGEAPAVKNFNGILVTAQESLDVECLPDELLTRIEVDISNLQEIGDAIYVKDLRLPSSWELLTNPEEMIVLVTAPQAEEVIEEEEEEVVEGEEPEVIEKGKPEEEVEEESE